MLPQFKWACGRTSSGEGNELGSSACSWDTEFSAQAGADNKMLAKLAGTTLLDVAAGTQIATRGILNVLKGRSPLRVVPQGARVGVGAAIMGEEIATVKRLAPKVGLSSSAIRCRTNAFRDDCIVFITLDK